MKTRLLQFFLGLALLSTQALAAPSVDGMRVDALRTPIGIDNPRPRLSWQIRSDQPSTLQTAYQIRVAPDDAPTPPLWESGRVDSARSIQIEYQGRPLQAGTRYVWQVRVWDNHGNTSPWSAPGAWETGLPETGQWRAQWITYPWQEDTKTSQPSPLLRKGFQLSGPIRRARLYITSLGLHEAYLNGRRVGDAHFTPGWTSYDKRLQYQVHDVTELLRNGANAIGVMLGDGWYRGFLTWDMQRNLYGDRLALLAQLRVTYADGREEWIATDESWQTATAELRASDLYNGELQDLRLRKTGWSQPDYAANGWQPAKRFQGTVPPLVASVAPPVKEMRVLKPVALLRGPKGEAILDMGQNMVGWVRFKARGQAGQKLTLHHAEVLDGQGALYLKALRAATAKMEYILPDDQPHTLQSHFSFHGFRYVQVDGYPDPIDPKDFEGVVLYSAMDAIGRFETSNPMLNRLQSNIEWGQRGNFLDLPTDCPQRDERLGWTGDIQVFTPTAAFNMDIAAFMAKWLADVRADQFDGGGIPHVVPDVLSRLKVHNLSTFFFNTKPSASGWGDAITVVPLALYREYGDRAGLETTYAAMKQWVEFERHSASAWYMTWLNYRNWFDAQRRADDRYIWNGAHTFGDWLAPAPVDNAFVNTVYFAHSAQLLSEAAHILGKPEDEKTYAALAGEVRAAFQRRFTDGRGRMVEDVQGAYVLALQFDLLDPAVRPSAAQRLNQLVKEAGNHLATGFLSTPHLLEVLTRHGYLDTAYAVLLQESYPSWLYPITKGATTIWERWGSIQPNGSFGDDDMNSFNHYANGAVGSWMYRTIAGLQPLEPGYKRFRVAPLPGGDLARASARLDSPYGPITAAWQRQGKGLAVSIDVPPNTTAEFVSPQAGTSIKRDGKPAAVGQGIEEVSDDAGHPRLVLGSGSYRFMVE